MGKITSTIRIYLERFYLRKWFFFVPAALIFGLSVVITVMLPPVYRSSATVLIDSTGIAESNDSSFANQRLQVIAKRVLTTRNVINLINEHNLYKNNSDKTQLLLLVEKFRKSVLLEIVNTDIIDPRSGKTGKAAIAFTLGFDHRSRKVARTVANKLVSLFVNENLRERRERSMDTLQFIDQETVTIRAAVEIQDRRISDFKTDSANALPDQLFSNLRNLDRAAEDLQRLERQLLSLEEQKIVLQSELEQLNPFGTYVLDGQTILSPRDRLKALKSRYVSLRANYGKAHPDIVMILGEIATLEAEIGDGVQAGDLNRDLELALSEWSLKRERYSDQHPDVVFLRRKVDTLRGEIENNRGEFRPATGTGEMPTNPAYISLRVRLRIVNAEVRFVRDQLVATTNKRTELDDRIARTPDVEREYLQLIRERDAMLVKFQEWQTKKMQADLARAVEFGQKNERYTLVEPPNDPLKPLRPNRILLLVAGLMCSTAIGGGSAFLAHKMDPSIYGRTQLATLIGDEPLVVIPPITTRQDIVHAWRRRIIGTLAFLVSVSLVVPLVHYFVAPVDVVLSIITNRFGI